MPENSNLEEYLHPDLYDLENPDFEPEGLFYLDLARETGGAVLELGCGSGRLTIPLAQRGLRMTGLEIVPGMLAAAREKAGDLPIEWVEADARLSPGAPIQLHLRSRICVHAHADQR